MYITVYSRKMDSRDTTTNKDTLPAVPFGRSFTVRVFLFTFMAMLLLIALVAMIFLLQVPMRGHFLFVWLELTVSALILSFLVAYITTRPILTLAKMARRIVEGGSSVPIDIKRNDEIGQILHFFKGTAKKVSESREREVSLSNIKSQFVTVAAHQLRTPLSALKWSLRLMLDGDMGEINEKQREFLKQSYQTNEHIIHLINDFLDISRIEEGRFGFQFKKTKILDTIQKAVEASMAQAVVREVTLSFTKDVPPDIEAIADESRMYTAVLNILDNAIRYSDTGGEVTVRAALKQGTLEIRITDTGIGIPPVEQSKIFSRFYRASNAIRQQTEGSGLGLFIAKNIIEHHGGSITFTSEEQKGTTVSFTIPVTDDFIKK